MSEYLTSSLPGTNGTLGPSPDDFFVEEIPLYIPCGEGEHLYLTVEKQGLTTFDLLNRAAQALGVRERDLGYAGLKDARAVTRQTISIPGVTPEAGLALNLPGVRVLAAKRHTNKLRPGHLAGNRFRIRIYDTCSDAGQRAADILAVLGDIGVPNRFGRQRFGVLGNSHRIGRALVQKEHQVAINEIIGDPERIKHIGWQAAAIAYRKDDYRLAIQSFPRHCRNERHLLERLVSGQPPGKAVLSMPRKLLRLYLSAYQSFLFDRILAMRIDSIGQLWQGDLAYKHDNGACFVVDNPAEEQPRANDFAISPSGPLFGYKMRLAQGQAGLLEQALLDKDMLQTDDFRLGKGLSMEGARRPLRVPLVGTRVQTLDKGLELEFQLPKGSFATAVLHEIMKCQSNDERLAGGLQ